jgi:multidrug/hemolysin transport system permease protein
MAVFFSLLGVLIVVLLYVLFLAKMQIDTLLAEPYMQAAEPEATYFIYMWVLSGILSMSCMTVSLSAQEVFVRDQETHAIYDFKTAPIKQGSYLFAGVFSGFLLSFIVSTVLFAGFSVYIFTVTGYALSFSAIILTLLLIALNAAVSSAFVAVLLTNLKTGAALGALNALFSSVLGFVNGSYIPVGVLGESVQNAIVAMPFVHSSSLFRQVLTVEAADKLLVGAPDAAKSEVMHVYGVDLSFAGNDVSSTVSLGYIVLFGLLAGIVGLVLHRNNSKNA